MKTFLEKYRGNIHSQNGEDLIIAECVRRIGITNGIAVEIGANDGIWLSNTAALLEQGWCGLLIEANESLAAKAYEYWHLRNGCVRVKCVAVNVDNINDLVPDCDVFSTDTDGEDYELFKVLKVKPTIVVIEIDSGYLPDDFSVNTDGGVGYALMVELAVSKGYFLVAHTGNLIFVANEYRDLFPDVADTEDAHAHYDASWTTEEKRRAWNA